MRAAFVAIALLAIGSAVSVILARKVTQAALLLGFSFFSIAGLYVVLGQDFLAAVQVLIYVGAITTMFLFAIMLSEQREIGEAPAGPVARGITPGVAKAVPVFAVGAFLLLLLRYLAGPGALPAAAGASGAPHSARDIGRLLFGTYLIPFEITSVILLAAVIGALLLAREEDRP